MKSNPGSDGDAAANAIVPLRIKVLPGTRRTCVTYRKDAYLPPAAFRFIEILKKVVGDMTRNDR